MPAELSLKWLAYLSDLHCVDNLAKFRDLEVRKFNPSQIPAISLDIGILRILESERIERRTSQEFTPDHVERINDRLIIFLSGLWRDKNVAHVYFLTPAFF